MAVSLATVLDVAAVALAAIPAITLHEAAHGWAASKLGDDTALRLGRVSANPLRHIDPFGTIVLPAMLYLAGGFLFGWAKPVPVAFHRLRNPRFGTVLVAAAGPASNIVMALIAGLLLHVLAVLPPALADWVGTVLQYGVLINIGLALFNLIPLPPLDGGRIAVGLLPVPLGRRWARVEPYGLLILLGLLFVLPAIGSRLGVNLDLIRTVLLPPFEYLFNLILAVTGNGSLP